MMNKQHFAAALCLVSAACSLGAATPNISPNNAYSYGANIGWMNWRSSANVGATLGSSFLSGHVYAANVGWISLGDGSPANGYRYQNQSGSDFGVNVNQNGTLSGFAYGANIGWINFTDTTATGKLTPARAPKLDLKTGKFSGFAYSANCGWIDLGSDLGFVKATGIDAGPDLDGDGIPDSWEQQYTGGITQLNGSGDLDNDGVSDKDEYAGDTNPADPQDLLRIVDITAANQGAKVTLTWTSKPSRCYALEKLHDLFNGNWEGIIPPGIINPDPGPTTSRVLNNEPVPNRFYRVQGLLPGSNFGP